MKKATFTFLFITFFAFSALAQQTLLPKGRWIAGDLLDVADLKVSMEIRIFSDTLVLDVINAEKQELLNQSVFVILKVDANQQKGKMLLKLVGEDKYSFGFFYRLSKDDVIIAPARADISSKQEAEDNFSKAEAWTIKKFNERRINFGEKPVQNVDPYRLGVIFRTKARIDALSKLPEITQDKRTYVKVLDALIRAFKNRNNQILYNQPSTALYLVSRVYEQNGLNPFTSFAKMSEGLKRYEYDSDVQDKAIDFKFYVVAKMNW